MPPPGHRNTAFSISFPEDVDNEERESTSLLAREAIFRSGGTSAVERAATELSSRRAVSLCNKEHSSCMC
jgi:hypothetical protein